MDARFAAYLLVAAVLIVTPGPDMALVTRNALRAGGRAAVFTGLGVGAGSAVWAAASGLGVAILLETSLVAFTILKLAGAAYLVWLGLRALLHRGAAPDPAPGSAPGGRRPAFVQGLVNNLLNPKAAAIFVTVLPQFVRAGDPPLRLLLMLLAWEVMIVGWLALYGRALARAGRTPAGRRARGLVERVSGGVMIGLGLRLAAERRTL